MDFFAHVPELLSLPCSFRSTRSRKAFLTLEDVLSGHIAGHNPTVGLLYEHQNSACNCKSYQSKHCHHNTNVVMQSHKWQSVQTNWEFSHSSSLDLLQSTEV